MHSDHDWISIANAASALSVAADTCEAEKTILAYIEDGRLSLAAELAIREADIGSPCLSSDFWRSERFLRTFPKQADRSWVEISPHPGVPVPLPLESFTKKQNWKIDTGSLSWQTGTIIARRPATFMNPLKTKRRIRVFPSAEMKPEISQIPSNPHLRLVAVGAHVLWNEVGAIISLYISEGRLPPSTSGAISSGFKNDLLHTHEQSDQEDRILPNEDKAVFAKMQKIISEGSFETHVIKYGRTFSQAGVVRAYERCFHDLNLTMSMPSNSTLKRRADELLALHRDWKAKHR